MNTAAEVFASPGTAACCDTQSRICLMPWKGLVREGRFISEQKTRVKYQNEVTASKAITWRLPAIFPVIPWVLFSRREDMDNFCRRHALYLWLVAASSFWRCAKTKYQHSAPDPPAWFLVFLHESRKLSALSQDSREIKQAFHKSEQPSVFAHYAHKQQYKSHLNSN